MLPLLPFIATFPERTTAVHLGGSSFSPSHNSFFSTIHFFNGGKIACFQQELDNFFHVLACHLHVFVISFFFLASTPNTVSFCPA